MFNNILFEFIINIVIKTYWKQRFKRTVFFLFAKMQIVKKALEKNWANIRTCDGQDKLC